MTHAVARLLAGASAACAGVAAPCGAQPVARDTAWRPAPAVAAALVARATRGWGAPPAGGWHGTVTLVRGDTAALDTLRAEVAGSDVTGWFTVVVRPARGTAPTLVARLRVGTAHAVPVVTRPLARGAVLAAADLGTDHAIEWGRPTRLADSVPATATLLGARLRRVVRAGEPLRTTDLEPAPVLHAGDSVVAEMERDGVRLTLPAVALRSAPIGARVPLRAARGRRFDGVVVSATLVRLDR
jgi:flagella basal body P-ring formation protein FlgA